MPTPWPHAPPHRLLESGTYMVTCGTFQKAHLLRLPHRLDFFQRLFMDIAGEFDWAVHAWAIMSNHYHFVAASPANPGSLSRMISKLHTLSARAFNREDETPGRKVWFQYFDTHLTFQASYYARLNYVHNNPVKHGLVHVARDYPWCSAGWFEKMAEDVLRNTVQSFKIDRVKVMDDFEPVCVEAKKSGVEPPHSKAF